MESAPELKEGLAMDLKELLARVEGAPAKAKRLKSPRSNQKMNKSARTTVSVIIPAHNEENYLEATLNALRQQKFPGCEVVVVANGCTDNTADVARGLCDQLVVLSQKSLGVARNLGARIAKGELLIFLDADTLLERHALRWISEEFTQAHAAGTVRGLPDAKPLAYRCMYGLKNFMHWSRLHHGSSGVIICWKEHFVRLGGFREDLEMRENSELIKRLERFGRYKYIGKVAATTSMRRYERRGFWRMIWLWTRLWFESLFIDLQNRKYETIR
jgi:hypothetical protein